MKNSTLHYLTIVIIGLSLFVSCSTGESIDFKLLNQELLHLIEQRTTDDETLLQSISHLGQVTEPPSFWTTIANNEKYTIKHRSRCIMALFRRHSHGCTN